MSDCTQYNTDTRWRYIETGTHLTGVTCSSTDNYPHAHYYIENSCDYDSIYASSHNTVGASSWDAFYDLGASHKPFDAISIQGACWDRHPSTFQLLGSDDGSHKPWCSTSWGRCRGQGLVGRVQVDVGGNLCASAVRYYHRLSQIGTQRYYKMVITEIVGTQLTCNGVARRRVHSLLWQDQGHGSMPDSTVPYAHTTCGLGVSTAEIGLFRTDVPCPEGTLEGTSTWNAYVAGSGMGMCECRST